MFRLSQFMHEIVAPTPVRPRHAPPGPVVIWNLIRRCNLTCKHCYSISADVDFPGELSTGEVYAVMDDLRSFGVPVLILSGGEPLLRPDIFDISRRAKEMGFYVGLSTNGTLITRRNIEVIAAIGELIASRTIGIDDESLKYSPTSPEVPRARKGSRLRLYSRSRRP